HFFPPVGAGFAVVVVVGLAVVVGLVEAVAVGRTGEGCFGGAVAVGGVEGVIAGDAVVAGVVTTGCDAPLSGGFGLSKIALSTNGVAMSAITISTTSMILIHESGALP